MITFLPADYKSSREVSDYFKPSIGENKIRILSQPLTGWEDWTLEKKPIRFPKDKKPLKPINHEKKIKEFWAVIIWNYELKAIQIWNFTQATIQDGILALFRAEEWGSPFFYDIKVTRKGSNKEDTEYFLNPLPHKPLPEEVLEKFQEKPINLNALIEGNDPFSHLQDSFTPGVFKKDTEIELQPMNNQMTLEYKLNQKQIDELTIILSKCEEGYKKKIWNFWKKEYKINSLADLPVNQYENIINGAMNHLCEIASKEVKEELNV